MFCERCGLSFLPRQSICTRCGEPSTRHWLQLISLATLVLAFVGNRLVAFYLLPGRATGQHSRMLFHAWVWFDQKAAWYGWMPLAVALLAWDLFVWRHSRPKVKGWVTRKLLTFAIIAGVTPIIPAWIPAGQPSDGFMKVVNKYPGQLSSLAWGVVVLVIALLCSNSETRDSLLGHGKALSLISLGVLLLLLTMTIVGWSLA
jgi:hypothetical protein